MDVWQLIAHDHAYIAHLIQETRHASGTTPARDSEEVLAGLIDELAAHAEALEASLYASLRRLDPTRQLAEDLHHEHRQFIRQLDDLARYQQTGPGHHSGMTVDVALIGHHLRRYTQELIPAARALLSSEQVDAAAHAFIRAKVSTLRSRARRRTSGLPFRKVVLTCLACATAAGLGYLAGQMNLLRRSKAPGRQSRRELSKYRGADSGVMPSLEPSSASKPVGDHQMRVRDTTVAVSASSSLPTATVQLHQPPAEWSALKYGF